MTPGLSPTIVAFLPTNRLIIVDLPQFGIPAIATLITGSLAPLAIILSTLSFVAILINLIKPDILLLCCASIGKTSIPCF